MSFFDNGDIDDADVRFAEKLCERLHAGQLDKGGAPYADHPKRVADAFDDPTLKVVALLHDSVEDTILSVEMIAVLFGQQVADAVALLTFDGDDFEAYLARVATDRLARAVKLADIADNLDPERLSKLRPRVRESLTLKYHRAQAVLLDRNEETR